MQYSILMYIQDYAALESIINGSEQNSTDQRLGDTEASLSPALLSDYSDINRLFSVISTIPRRRMVSGRGVIVLFSQLPERTRLLSWTECGRPPIFSGVGIPRI